MLLGGWATLRETLLFATDASVAAALYSSRGGPGPAPSSSSSSSSRCGGSFAYDYVDDATVALGEDGVHISFTPTATTAGTRISHAARRHSRGQGPGPGPGPGGEDLSETDDGAPGAPPLPPQLAAAARKKLLLVLACTLALPETSGLYATASAQHYTASYACYTDNGVAGSAASAAARGPVEPPARVTVSARDGARTVDALRGLDHPAVYLVDAAADDVDDAGGGGAGVSLTHPSLLFALPPPAFTLRACLSSLELDHACLCLSPPMHIAPTPTTTISPTPAAAAFVVGLGSGNVKSLEGQLELLLTPSRRLDRNATLLADFDKQIDTAVRYVYARRCGLMWWSIKAQCSTLTGTPRQVLRGQADGGGGGDPGRDVAAGGQRHFAAGSLAQGAPPHLLHHATPTAS